MKALVHLVKTVDCDNSEEYHVSSKNTRVNDKSRNTSETDLNVNIASYVSIRNNAVTSS
jgi:hypothetical protein